MGQAPAFFEQRLEFSVSGVLRLVRSATPTLSKCQYIYYFRRIVTVWLCHTVVYYDSLQCIEYTMV